MTKVIVTGAGRGIGFELVRSLADDGCVVIAVSRRIDALERLANPLILPMSVDITKSADLNALYDFVSRTWDKVDVLVNNAGLLVKKPLMELTEMDFMQVYAVNVFGAAALTRRIVPMMPQSGHVVGISSIGGVQGSVKFPGLSAYSSSKAALIALGETWAEEFKETGPSFNTLALGAVQTEMLEVAFPGYRAPVTPTEMAAYIKDFALTGQRLYNGKLLQLGKTTP